MTDRDESSEGFLQRWSRKKIDAEQEPSDPPQLDEPSSPAPAAENRAVAPATAQPKPEFDLASLPSLESITAGTDIRAFLNPGVPAEIARAALRRAWVSDPTIRDFVGLAENAWDFNDPKAMPGFGPLEPGYDIKRALAQMFGEVEKLADDTTPTDVPAAAQPNHPIGQKPLPEAPARIELAETRSGSGPSEAPTEEAQNYESDFVHRDNITASHKSISEVDDDEPRPRRNHGGALPQ